MEQTALFGPPLALDVPAYTPPPPLPPPREPAPVVSLSIARQRLRGVKSTRTMNYARSADDGQA